MKRFLVCLTTLACSFAYAFDANLAINTAAPLEGAVDAITDLTITTYIPGFGIQISSVYSDPGSDPDTLEYARLLTSFVQGLSGTIEGLEPNDYVSVTMFVTWYDQEGSLTGVNLAVRMRPGKPGSLVGWWDDVSVSGEFPNELGGGAD